MLLSSDLSIWAPVLNLLRDGIAIVGEDGRIPGCNDAAARAFELPASILNGSSLSDLIDTNVPVCDGFEGTVRIRASGQEAHVYGRLLASEKPCLALVFQAANSAGAQSEWCLHLTGLSHDLRTPLATVLGFAELALDTDGLTAEDRPRIRAAVRRNGELLLRLADDVLDLSVAEHQRKLAPTERLFSPAGLMESLLASHGIGAQAKNLDLSGSVDKNVPSALIADHVRLHRVASNVISNAIKYADKGYVRLTMGLDKDANGQVDSLKLLVEDTGVGIDERRKASLFKPFERGEAQSARPGHGLGLFLARNVARAIGGDVHVVRSSKEAGSVFEISVPAHEA